MTPSEILAAVQQELDRANANFKPFNSAHEAYAVLLEEMDELWDEVKKNQSKRDWHKIEKEAIQVAAMAVRLITDVIQSKSPGHEKLGTVTTYHTAPSGRPPEAPIVITPLNRDLLTQIGIWRDRMPAEAVSAFQGVARELVYCTFVCPCKICGFPYSKSAANNYSCPSCALRAEEEEDRVEEMDRPRNADDMGMPP